MKVLFIDLQRARVFIRAHSFRQYLLTYYRTIRQRTGTPDQLAILTGTGKYPRQHICPRQHPCCLGQY
ncbi:hypothetical protein [Spirosoma aerophilum]